MDAVLNRSSFRVRLPSWLALAAGLLAPAAAGAQIYVARDANGTLVLSDRPLGANQTVYAIANTPGILATRAASRGASEYDVLIERQATAHRVRPELVRAVIQVESAFNPVARSNKGAVGLMQLMPGTAAEVGVDDPYDPAQNIAGGVLYLRTLLDRFDGNEELALAAYNAGPGAVERYGQRIPPYRETQAYVERVKDRTAGLRAGASTIYRVFEVVDGREIARYTNLQPRSGQYEIVTRR